MEEDEARCNYNWFYLMRNRAVRQCITCKQVFITKANMPTNFLSAANNCELPANIESEILTEKKRKMEARNPGISSPSRETVSPETLAQNPGSPEILEVSPDASEEAGPGPSCLPAH